MVLALAGALLAAVCYGVASVLQSMAANAVARGGGLDLGLLGRLVRQRTYLAGLAADGVGFLASVLALRSLPLFLVQSAIAGSVGVTAVVASRVLGVRLTRREWLALVALGAGLVLLGLSAHEGSAAALPLATRWAVLVSAAVLALTAARAGSLRPAVRLPALGALAGLAFAATGVAARSLEVPSPWWHVVADPLAWALPVQGLLGAQLFAMALQSGSVTVASAVTFVVETVVPSAVGLWLLGDSTRAGLAPVAAAGFVLAVVGAVLLSRFAGEDFGSAHAPEAAT